MFDIRLICLIFVVSISAGENARAKESPVLDIRPIEITILNADSGKPIENIQVYYAVDAYIQKKGTVGFLFPNLETRGTSRFLIKEKKLSDKDGKVVFHATNLSLSEGEIVEHEFLYINIDIEMEHPDVQMTLSARGSAIERLDILKNELLAYDPAKKFFFNPNPSYAGFYVMSTYREQGPDDCASPLWDIIDYKCIGEGLTKASEKITVRLREARH